MSSALLDRLGAIGGRDTAVSAGRFVFHAGDRVAAVFVVVAGEVRLIRHQPDGAALTLQRARAGSVLAEASVYSARYHCDAVAATDATMRLFRLGDVRRRLRQDADFAEAWAAHLAHEVQAARLRSEVLSLRTVAARVDAWLAWGGHAVPPKGGGKPLAEELGVSPEALYRELARRRSDG